MIISRTPIRISFVGGGSDIQDFYSHHPGAVLSTSINKYMYISSHRYFDKDIIQVKYSRTETVDSLDKIQHPILREGLRKLGIVGGIEISSIADIPSGTGMGSSSAFTVGLLHNLYAIKRNFVTQEKLAREACEIEIDILKEPIGKQDQYAAAFGGLNIIHFNSDGNVKVEPLYIKKEVRDKLKENLVLFYTGSQRKASDILSEQKRNISNEEKSTVLKSMVSLVFELRDCLYNENLDDFGKILHENWMLKQKMASLISNGHINKIYDTAMRNGASGGKLLGAGGGGFLLFYCEKPHQKRLIEALKPLRTFDMDFDYEGTKIIYFGDE